MMYVAHWDYSRYVTEVVSRNPKSHFAYAVNHHIVDDTGDTHAPTSYMNPKCVRTFEKVVHLMARIDELSFGFWTMSAVAGHEETARPYRLIIRVEATRKFLESVGVGAEIGEKNWLGAAPGFSRFYLRFNCVDCARIFVSPHGGHWR